MITIDATIAYIVLQWLQNVRGLRSWFQHVQGSPGEERARWFNDGQVA